MRTTPPTLTVLWSGSTLGAVRSAGESTERRPMFAPGTISPGQCEVGEEGNACSDKVALEKVEEEAVGRMRRCVDNGSVPASALLLLTLTRAWRVKSVPLELAVVSIAIVIIRVKIERP